MCGHTFLYSPPVRAVKELLDASELGEIFFISSSRVNLGLHQRDVSVIWDLGPHDFSILLYWLGELPTTVRAVGRDSIVPGIPDVAFVTLSFPSGHRRQRRAELAGAEQAAAHGRSSAARRWSSTTTAPRSRSASSTTASSTRTRRPSASTTSPTARATSSRRSSTADEPLAARARGLRRRDPQRR